MSNSHAVRPQVKYVDLLDATLSSAKSSVRILKVTLSQR